MIKPSSGTLGWVSSPLDCAGGTRPAPLEVMTNSYISRGHISPQPLLCEVEKMAVINVLLTITCIVGGLIIIGLFCENRLLKVHVEVLVDSNEKLRETMRELTHKGWAPL